MENLIDFFVFRINMLPIIQVVFMKKLKWIKERRGKHGREGGRERKGKGKGKAERRMEGEREGSWMESGGKLVSFTHWPDQVQLSQILSPCSWTSWQGREVRSLSNNASFSLLSYF